MHAYMILSTISIYIFSMIFNNFLLSLPKTHMPIHSHAYLSAFGFCGWARKEFLFLASSAFAFSWELLVGAAFTQHIYIYKEESKHGERTRFEEASRGGGKGGRGGGS